MVLNSRVAVQVANVSASLCQYISCNPEILRSEEVLDLIFCFPFQQIRRLFLCFSTFFCFPPLDPFSSRSFSASSSSSSDDSISSGYDSHSD
ncbi:hypothetical protein Nepgr_030227 [Nepenthes gracilis]|uniref:Uncharacterized protein n=1 Tax=Nepenthes gracilis TaxID=150966 RepID=A0AAD3TFY2_NEPGR|nr:hypothetical protein Nepgr_030227 [Nepenthes gracilis]